jgi:hypothetical protein
MSTHRAFKRKNLKIIFSYRFDLSSGNESYMEEVHRFKYLKSNTIAIDFNTVQSLLLSTQIFLSYSAFENDLNMKSGRV